MPKELSKFRCCQSIYMLGRHGIVKLAATASVLGVLAPLVWLVFVNYCYQPQFPLTAEGPPPLPRFVDHVVNYTPFVLWPAAVLLLPATVPNPSSHESRSVRPIHRTDVDQRGHLCRSRLCSFPVVAARPPTGMTRIIETANGALLLDLNAAICTRHAT